MKPRLIHTTELQLADKIILSPEGSHAYDTATVEKIVEGGAKVLRPYVHTAGFSCTSGVICYIGFEQFVLPMDDRQVMLMDRKELK